jgi:uncharacterized membrane-anchored protein YitT (DUF2179 family)
MIFFLFISILYYILVTKIKSLKIQISTTNKEETKKKQRRNKEETKNMLLYNVIMMMKFNNYIEFF